MLSLYTLVYFILTSNEICLSLWIISVKVSHLLILLCLNELCTTDYVIFLIFTFFSNNTESFLNAAYFEFWIEIVSDLDWQSENFAFECSLDEKFADILGWDLALSFLKINWIES